MKSKLLSIAVSMATMLVLDAKKVTKDFLTGEIADVKYQRLDGTLTHCTITTHDGFTFTGESACIDPAQFDEEIGKQIAYNQAFDKMWTPYGFWLNKTLKHQHQPEDGENWYQQQYAKIANEADVSSDAPAEDVLTGLQDDIKYMANCASLEDLTVLLEDGLDDETQAQKAVAIVKEYYKNEANTLAHFGNI